MPTWHKSTHSGGEGSNRLAATDTPGLVPARDSKHPSDPKPGPARGNEWWTAYAAHPATPRPCPAASAPCAEAPAPATGPPPLSPRKPSAPTRRKCAARCGPGGKERGHGPAPAPGPARPRSTCGGPRPPPS
ncbi:DUF397 domain-containing protein [Streptomyces sp. NPDC102467]|uniref:DUF397 domain-containing protein n=1 Tax=Streptomyces sp. NPDC102467 TaxID=3366179 RepID=UPI0038184AA6